MVKRDPCQGCPAADSGIKLFLKHLGIVRRETGYGEVTVQVKDGVIVHSALKIGEQAKMELSLKSES